MPLIHMFERQKLSLQIDAWVRNLTFDPVNGKEWAMGITWHSHGYLDLLLFSRVAVSN